MTYPRATAAVFLCCLAALASASAWAQPSGEVPPGAAPAVPPLGDDAGQPAAAVSQEEAPAAVRLSLEQEQIAERFRRLEELMLRMAELTAAEDPARAALLRQTVAKGKERLVGVQFERIIELLGADRLTNAVTGQGEIMQDLKTLLDLLMSEDRAKRLKSEQERIREYLKEVNKLIKDQQGIQAQTDRGGQLDRLAQRQGDLANRTDKLGEKIRDDEAEADGKSADEQSDSESDDGQPSIKQPSSDKPADGKSGEGKPSDGDPASGDGKPSDKPSAGESADGKSEGKPGDGKPQESQPSDDDAKPGEEPSAAGEPQAGKPSEGDASGESPEGSKDSPSQPGQEGGQPGESGGEPSESGSGSQSPPAESETEQRLRNAQERMRQAKEKLEQALRDEAIEEQEQALRELEAAKSELEKILRQMREEELARLLALLEARFRKMLEMQVEVYEGTIRLDRLPVESRGRGSEIESGRLSRSESLIVIEADKALTLLREEGSAVAMPEALEQARDDMQNVMQRLAEFDVGPLTQGIEEDIIASLEEMIAALQKAQQDMESQQNQQQPPPPGQPQDPQLIDQLAELRMIRSLQMRVNRRTETYSKLIDGERADRPELLQALNELAERQNRIYRTTRDIVVGRNQ